ncbi:DUF397 domain-containing protein [Streptomyces roseirectus]|uniref:DUF397 domain-containing protein n=1 Tax=Streptomyces roseirectus TaxID=2768066 RepID=A0A7H0IA69_9ACTN|nr:DUF397 domain-containing protein [Streptomyces roseirectus]QNP69685.1 DUF397 domain-containing protein [Streptomyces roseirectus]
MAHYIITDASVMDVSWKKASTSGANGNCVELAPYQNRIAIRDSKSPHGPAILYSHSAATTLLISLKSDTF